MVKNPEFASFRKKLDAEMKRLKVAPGIQSAHKKAEPILESEEEILWEKGLQLHFLVVLELQFCEVANPTVMIEVMYIVALCIYVWLYSLVINCASSAIHLVTTTHTLLWLPHTLLWSAHTLLGIKPSGGFQDVHY